MKVKEQKLKQVFAKMFEVDADAVNDLSSMNTIESWDSMKHIMFVFALEEEFSVSFDVEESVEMTNYLAIKKVLKDHDIELC